MNTGAASKGPLESRLATKLRSMSDDIRNLKHQRATTAFVGGWRLTEDAAGNLVADYPATGATQIVALASLPEENT